MDVVKVRSVVDQYGMMTSRVAPTGFNQPQENVMSD